MKKMWIIIILLIISALVIIFFVLQGAQPQQTVTLNMQNDSGQDGVAELREENGQLVVEISVTPGAEGVAQPAHIHSGSCDNLGSIVYPLENLTSGTSTTTLEVSMAELLGQLPLAINGHKSGEEVGVYITCGELQAN